MKLADLEKEIQKYQYFEDTGVIRVVVASMLSNRLKISKPTWLVLIGASSGGKSQIIRPMAQSDTKFIHQLDDITENTFLSGGKAKGGGNTSLLLREDGIGTHGVISISDLTILLSKSSDARASILSQFRALYDGEMTKYVGNSKNPLHWKGYLGIIAGSTPSLYRIFEEYSDLGERFIYYRMRDFNAKSATKLALSRKLPEKEMNQILADNYGNYIKDLVLSYADKEIPELSEEIQDKIINIASFSETVRTPVQYDWKQEEVTRIPVVAYPMRIALQMSGIAKALSVMRHNESGSFDLLPEDIRVIEWIGYSLANEEKRACLKILAQSDYNYPISTQTIADEVGLNTNIVRTFLQNLSAVGILKRTGLGDSLAWGFKEEEFYKLVRKFECIDETTLFEEREVTQEETQELNEIAEREWNRI